MKYVTKQTVSIFWKHARAYPWALFFIIIGIIGAEVSSLIPPLYYKQLIDNIALGTDIHTLYTILIMVFVFYGINWVSYRIIELANSYFQTTVMRDLMNFCFGLVHRHATSFFDSTFVGSLVKKMNRFSRAFNRIADRIIWNFLPLIISLAGIMYILGERSVWFVVFIIVWLCCFIFGNISFSKYKLKFDIQRSEQDSRVTGVLADTVTNHQNVKFLNGYQREVVYFSKETKVQQRLEKWTWDLSHLSFAIQGIFIILLEFAVLYMAINLWQQGILTVGDFVLIQAYLIQLFEKTWTIGHMIRDFYEALADAEEMTQILETPHAIVDSKTAIPLVVTNGEINFHDVSFEYNKTRTILDTFNITISGGERVALVGHSGAGKSTISKLLLRMHDVSRGSIAIDGQKIHRVTLESLWHHISYVPQEPILFHRSLMENIRYGKPDASDEEVIEAAKLAHADTFIATFPEGYDTHVGERGVKLSGGERQRVAIARAILKNAPILILDEATSSLDSESEMLIQDALDTLMKQKTVIVIAHRLSTIMKMDRILVMEDGHVIEDGSHKQLLRKKNGRYKRLWNLQAGEFIGG